jgi:ubiquinone/menaquinone biosynthesis C-methylase UbiE
MDDKRQELDYLDLQAYVGTTKHMGGQSTTQELIELCHIVPGLYVIDVGCGVGATACYLAASVGCRVVGVDLREAMVERARARARRENVADRVTFRVADARDLPFADGSFDIVLCESVATFVEDKGQLAAELARVARPGGRVGLNEEVWLKDPPPELAASARRIWQIDWALPTVDEWVGMLEDAGLCDILARTYAIDPRRESSQLKRYHVGDMLRMFYRSAVLYVRDPAFRTYMASRRRLPKGMFSYLGYAILAASKPALHRAPSSGDASPEDA